MGEAGWFENGGGAWGGWGRGFYHLAWRAGGVRWSRAKYAPRPRRLSTGMLNGVLTRVLDGVPVATVLADKCPRLYSKGVMCKR